MIENRSTMTLEKRAGCSLTVPPVGAVEWS